jgi:hypothetical protein
MFSKYWIFRGEWPVASAVSKKAAVFSRPKIYVVAFLCALFATAQLQAAKNPLNTIGAETFDSQSGGIKIESCSEGGSDLFAIENGGYALYKGYDFDSGVAGFKARISSLNKGSVEIRLDSPTGPLIGSCPFNKTRGWEDITCKVDHSQAGVRDVYLVFKGDAPADLVKITSFVFLKSIVGGPQVMLGSRDRVDEDDNEPQAATTWGMPETGFADNFSDGQMKNWKGQGMSVVKNALTGEYSAETTGPELSYAVAPDVYINKTDTGGEWRTLAEASLSADIVIDSPLSRPGIGFSSKDAKQSVYVVLNANLNAVEAWRRLSDGSVALIKQHLNGTNSLSPQWTLQAGAKYRLQVDWSPYSDGLIAFLYDDKGVELTSFRTAIDLPAARRPLLICSGGKARFHDVKFDPTLDGWNCKWEWKKEPVLTSDVCNPAVWKWKDGKYYMMWRKFGKDTYHGIASSTDAVHWTRINDEVLKCTGDMNVLMNPFGDGLVYVTPGGADMPWYTSDGTSEFTVWKKSPKKLGYIFGNSRIQEIIDTKQYRQMKPVPYGGEDYRFIAFTENWTDAPQPHTVVLLSNTLTNWVLANPFPVIPPGTNFWGEKGNAIGSAMVLPDGNILLASCSCTFEGYTGAPEPSNVSAIVDGREPWKVLKLGTLPDAPVSRENVWYQGPNFGTAYYYEPANDTLFFYGGFHDYHIGVLRVQNFSHTKIFAGLMKPAAPTAMTSLKSNE